MNKKRASIVATQSTDARQPAKREMNIKGAPVVGLRALVTFHRLSFTGDQPHHCSDDFDDQLYNGQDLYHPFFLN